MQGALANAVANHQRGQAIVYGAISAVHGLSSRDKSKSPIEPSRRAARGTRLRLLSAAEAGRAAEHFTDGELVTLALNGVNPAFSRLLERHGPHLRRLVTRRLRNPDDALDVIQDTHLAVWRALRSYDAGRSFEAWITSIALNKCRDWIRRRAVHFGLISRLQADADRDGAGIEGRSAERLVMEEESVRDLGQALEGLPEKLRRPLILTALLEQSQAAAARELRLTRKAVEMRVRRARQHLEQALPA